LFLIRGEPETYNLPPNPEVPTIYLRDGWKSAARDGVLLLAGVAAAFLAARSGSKKGIHV
jgi:formate dehydrogenase iron-sulfur subunit